MRLAPTGIRLKYVPDAVLTVAEDSCRCGSCVTHKLTLHEDDVDPWPKIAYNWHTESSWVGLDAEDAMHRLATTVWELGVRVAKAERITAELSVDLSTMSDPECRALLENLQAKAKAR